MTQTRSEMTQTQTTRYANPVTDACAARLVMVTTSLDSHEAIALPTDLRAALELYQETCP
jgi:acyl-CoA thioesterase FadM